MLEILPISLSRLLLGLALSCATLEAVASAAQAGTQEKILFILDGSGSMKAKIDQVEKIAIAKEVMIQLIKDLPDQVQAGLEVYGHRSKGDCGDIELMVPIGQGNKSILIDKIQSINPKGKTPITKALELAAERLRTAEEESTLVLITDGQETCEADPCALVKSLKGQGIKLKVHVVGFDVSREEKDQLVCIANAGGGKYFTANNTAQLKEALTEVKQAVVAKIEARKPEPTPKTEAPGLRLTGVLKEGGPAIDKDISWKILETKADLEGQHKQIAYEIGPSRVFHLPSGRYLVNAKYGDARVSREIEVKAEEAATQIIVFEAGQIRLSGILTQGGSAIEKDIVWKIYEPKTDLEGQRKQVAYEISPNRVFTLAAGRYLLEAKYGDALAKQEIEIKAGETSNQAIDFNAGQIRLSAALSEGGPAIAKDIVWKIYEAKADLEGQRKRAAYEIAPSRVFTLPAGHYLVEPNYGDAHIQREIEIKPGDGYALTINLNAGQVKLGAVSGGSPLTKNVEWRIYQNKAEQEDKGKRVAYEIKASHVFTLNAGDYLVEARLGEARVETEFSLKAGEQKELPVEIK